ncbi:MAG: Methionyl-tRNA formyltransferase [Acidimicrobiales bacterium]|nr:Methionyl-tRNA formyltransferase [Acidimicrobiales bacterium]
MEAGFEVVLVVSQPDKKRGRGGQLSPSPVKAAALELGLPVTDRVDDVLDTGADLGVVVAYGKLIKPHVLDRVPMVNLHFSLLPRWRGAAPVERALLAGDAETGVDLMELEEGLDTGGVYAEARLAIGPEETADELRERLVAVGTDLLVTNLTAGLGKPRPQEGEPTYASKIDPTELELRWERPAVELHRLVRLGRAWTTFRGKRLKVLAARLAATDGGPGELDGSVVGTGDGGLELIVVQPEGKGPQEAPAWRHGARPEAGERVG